MAVPSKIILYQLNDQLLFVDGLQDEDGSYVNVATVLATLKNREGTVIAPISALTLAYVPTSNGRYEGVVEDTFNPPKGGGYTLFVDSTDGTTKGHWEIPVEVKVRKS